ncbi:GntR family transcriptional regulator [Streptomyces sp. DSM 42041]|uniref:GntR family transcriptional regulator n=1 Tax=Streptomyces hazeniae TaxID=3075538 RepID=A0ABU2NP48_9ACTN|nr:GntR family transcriptional regulator [Streptomyces sp. DSM 42041]MDT0378550.1 GntR family transcriptional regulator [Streptomyces sp. DSM 42041]
MPLTPEQSERLAVLYEKFGTRLVGYARRKLTGYGWGFAAAESLAEDIAQEAWIEVSRTGAKDLLRPDVLSDNETRGMLFARVKTQIGRHFGRSRSHERPVDWSDPVTCNVLCPLMSEPCPLTAPSASLLRLVDALPERERAALLLRLDGCPMKVLGEHLECDATTGRRLVDTALLRLQLCHAEAAREPVALATLPAWQREGLAKLPDAQREALLRVDDLPRQVLLLHLGEGLHGNEIAARLGVPRDAIKSSYICAVALKNPGAAPSTTARKKGEAARALAEVLRGEVAELAPGERVPAERVLMARLRCSSKTVRTAMKTLRDEGLVTSRGSQGMYRSTTGGDLAVAA